MSDIHEFILVIDRALGDDEQNALFEAGFDDSTPEVEADRTLLHVVREASTLTAALASAVLGLERAGVAASGVGSNDLVDLPEIAGRVGRSRESIRLLAAGKRGPGGFPAARDGFYSWVAVREWFARYAPETVGSPGPGELAYDRIIAAADHLVQARTLLRGHAEDLRQLLPA
jgi:hypothetical protein